MGKSAQNPETSGHEYNRITFMIREYLKNNVHTALPVKVKEVFPTPPGIPEKERIGLVHVELAIEQMDNKEQLIKTKPLYWLPYLRVQGGHCAFVVDPEPDDWGLAVFAEKDVSKWKRTLKRDMPPTYRVYDQADGFYLGGMLNKKPKLYVQIHPELGIIIESDTKNLKVHCGGDATIHVEGNCTSNVDKDCSLAVKGNASTTVQGTCTVQSQGACNISSQGDMNINSGGTCNINSGSGPSPSGDKSATVNDKGQACCGKSCSPNYEDSCCKANDKGQMCCKGSCSPNAQTSCMEADPVNKVMKLKDKYVGQ